MYPSGPKGTRLTGRGFRFKSRHFVFIEIMFGIWSAESSPGAPDGPREVGWGIAPQAEPGLWNRSQGSFCSGSRWSGSKQQHGESPWRLCYKGFALQIHFTTTDGITWELKSGMLQFREFLCSGSHSEYMFCKVIQEMYSSNVSTMVLKPGPSGYHGA